MENLGNRYALAALKKQRALLAGEIASAKSALKWKQDQLEHLDCTLRLLDPTIDPKGLPVSMPRKRLKLFRQGELSRLVTDALRRAGKPVGTHEVASAVMEAEGLEDSVRPTVTPRIRTNLGYQEGRGTVLRTGRGVGVLWALKS